MKAKEYKVVVKVKVKHDIGPLIMIVVAYFEK